jgi:serine/threonine protein kinase
MGVVFLAEQVHLRRQVALKVLRDDLVAHPKAVERFRAEVKAAGRLSHPNIVTTYDADQVSDTWFLVTEWVQGTPLNDVVAQQGPLPVALACDYMLQVANGLQHAFEQGIIHRDIKPHNLLLAADGTVKILDFGLARFVAEWDPEGSLTDFGTGLGTPDYVAPEQARNARAADIRADIYSLGCTLYFLLVGRAPFPESSAAEKIAGHLGRTPTPLTELRTDLAPGLGYVVERMMAKDPAQRFQTPADAARALEPFFCGGPLA